MRERLAHAAAASPLRSPGRGLLPCSDAVAAPLPWAATWKTNGLRCCAESELASAWDALRCCSTVHRAAGCARVGHPARCPLAEAATKPRMALRSRRCPTRRDGRCRGAAKAVSGANADGMWQCTRKIVCDETPLPARHLSILVIQAQISAECVAERDRTHFSVLFRLCKVVLEDLHTFRAAQNEFQSSLTSNLQRRR